MSARDRERAAIDGCEHCVVIPFDAADAFAGPEHAESKGYRLMQEHGAYWKPCTEHAEEKQG